MLIFILTVGEVIVNKLAEPDCGVIGFGGSKVKLSSYSGWYQCGECTVNYFYQNLHNGLTAFRASNTYLERSFEEVIVLDGLGGYLLQERCFGNNIHLMKELLTEDFIVMILILLYKSFMLILKKIMLLLFKPGS